MMLVCTVVMVVLTAVILYLTYRVCKYAKASEKSSQATLEASQKYLGMFAAPMVRLSDTLRGKNITMKNGHGSSTVFLLNETPLPIIVELNRVEVKVVASASFSGADRLLDIEMGRHSADANQMTRPVLWHVENIVEMSLLFRSKGEISSSPQPVAVKLSVPYHYRGNRQVASRRYKFMLCEVAAGN